MRFQQWDTADRQGYQHVTRSVLSEELGFHQVLRLWNQIWTDPAARPTLPIPEAAVGKMPE